MSHDTHQSGTENKSKMAFNASFWFILILVFVFIAAVNFVNVMSKEGGEEPKTEAHEGGSKAEGEKKAESATEAPKAMDTAHAAAH